MYPLGDVAYSALSGPNLAYGPDGKDFSNIKKGGRAKPDADTHI